MLFFLLLLLFYFLHFFFVACNCCVALLYESYFSPQQILGEISGLSTEYLYTRSIYLYNILYFLFLSNLSQKSPPSTLGTHSLRKTGS